MPKQKAITVSHEIDQESISIVQMLADGDNVPEVSEKLKYNRRSLERKIDTVKKTCGVNTLPHLVAFFFRNKLVK